LHWQALIKKSIACWNQAIDFFHVLPFARLSIAISSVIDVKYMINIIKKGA
jgi:hypothetical protein